ncbi:MAG: non-canonical purine NTP diphosphatase [Salibacteraceae bacterium]
MNRPNTTLIFATGNAHKVSEISNAVPNWIEVKSMGECGFTEEIVESGTTLSENAKIKADAIHQHFEENCFADDTGLMVDALNGAPGVFSARYAGEGCSFQDNVSKLLREMKGKKNRSAHFSTIISLWWNGRNIEFEGRVNGTITLSPKGSDGFGYDPIFQPEGYSRTFSEMSLDEKNRISHRAIAVRKLIEFLQNQQ